MNVGSAALVALAWIGVMFAVAAIAEARGQKVRLRLRHAAYTLALGVYCSSWTVYGAVGSVVREGWNYLPIYLAPILTLLVVPGFLRRLAAAVAEEQATTLSDFIAARFGHDVVVARLVTLIALAGSVPYMALQLRSIGAALSLMTGREVFSPTMIVAALVLALFAIAFGARRFERAARSEGMVYAMGLESLVKIGALLMVGGLGISLMAKAGALRLAAGLEVMAHRFSPAHLSLESAVIAALSACAILVLPRQFYMALLEARETDDLVRARWGLAGYLALIALLVP